MTLEEQERAAYAAGDYELANALGEISRLEDEILRLQNLLDDQGIDYAKN